jgi:hypothetical protein
MGTPITALRNLAMTMAAVAVVACKPAPGLDADSGKPAAGADAEEMVTFRAKVHFPEDFPRPQGASLVVYLVAADIESGKTEVIEQSSVDMPDESPANVELRVPLAALDLDTAYEMSAALVDTEGQALMNAIKNRPPAPAMALQWESVFNIRLMPRATPLEGALVFRLPGPLSFDCGDLAIDVRQEDDGGVVVTMPDRELRLPPAAATAGGRFSGATHELWITDSMKAFLLSLTEPQRECALR